MQREECYEEYGKYSERGQNVLIDPMNLGDFLKPENVLKDLKARNCFEAIDELLENLMVTKKIRAQDREPITALLREREAMMSTAIGAGIAIPHAVTNLVDEPVAALGRSTGGLDFDMGDNRSVTFVMLFLVPDKQPEKHIHTLASIAKFLQSKEFRESFN